MDNQSSKVSKDNQTDQKIFLSNYLLKATKKKVIKSVIWFVAVLIATIVIAILHINNGSSENAFILFVGVLFLIAPALLSFTSAIKSVGAVRQCQEKGTEIPKSMEVTLYILLLQLPLFALILVGSSMIKPEIVQKRVEVFISEKYPQGYTIIGRCGHFDESIQDYTVIQFNVEGLDSPVTAKYDWRSNTYEDSYSGGIPANWNGC